MFVRLRLGWGGGTDIDPVIVRRHNHTHHVVVSGVEVNEKVVRILLVDQILCWPCAASVADWNADEAKRLMAGSFMRDNEEVVVPLAYILVTPVNEQACPERLFATLINELDLEIEKGVCVGN